MVFLGMLKKVVISKIVAKNLESVIQGNTFQVYSMS